MLSRLGKKGFLGAGRRWVLGGTAALAVLAGCGPEETLTGAAASMRSALGQASPEEKKGAEPTAVGLALEAEDGVGVTLRVRAGQRFYINQIDLRASVTASHDEGVAGLGLVGDFAHLDWKGVRLVEQEPILLPNADGTYTQRRFFRDAKWMEVQSTFTVQPVDARGRPTGRAITLKAGSDNERNKKDDFFVRRFRAIQWVYDCPSANSCAGASNFLEEALVELRNARTVDRTYFSLSAETQALELHWSQRPGAPFVIPVEQVQATPYAYGFSVDVQALTPPAADGTYAPGSNVTFQLTLRDGAGNRLHPAGSLPTYNEVAFGENPAGIQYYRAFFDPTTTYYRRKHRERMLMSQVIGPAHRIQPIRSIVELGAFLDPNDDVQTTALPERDGVFAQMRLFPEGSDLFGGAFDPTHAGWAAPVSDTWSYRIPENAEPGTYLVTVKGRRTWMGEDVPASRTVEIQVGTPAHTKAALTTGGCNACHTEGGELSSVLHGNGNRAACASCHAPLGFELEGPIFVRTHFLHSRSDRFDAPLEKCSTCHVSPEGIQRTSKAACLSCHKSYPDSHVAKFGPIESMYVGGGRESFQQCTGACHTGHPGSGF